MKTMRLPLTKKGQVIHYLATFVVFLSCAAPARAGDLDIRALLILNHQQVVIQQPIITTHPAARFVSPTVTVSHPPMPSITAAPLYYYPQPWPTIGVAPNPIRSYSVSCIGRG
jgi:hypothetical protein